MEVRMTTPPPLDYQKPTPPKPGTAATGSMVLWVLAALFFLGGIVRHAVSVWDVGIFSGIGLIVGAVAIFNSSRSALAWTAFALNAAILLLVLIVPR